ncbi:MAG: Type IV pilus assembly PilZ, partial [Thermodesulfobacterium sp. 37_54]
MYEKDKRYYTRYKIRLEGKVATEKGQVFPVEILDLSIEGARLKT